MKVPKMDIILLFLTCGIIQSVKTGYGTHNDIGWVGGPFHLECQYAAELLTRTGQHVKDNVIAIKAVSFLDDIYVLTPRLKPGVPATVCEIVRGRKGPELQAFPELASHKLDDCDAIQNAIDFYLDHSGTLWILDSGIVDSLTNPRCSCPPKILGYNLHWRKRTHSIQIAEIEPTSMLQNIAVESGITGTYVYISDASRGAVLIHELSSHSWWSTVTCPPSSGLQLLLTKHTAGQTSLILNRMPHAGLLEIDTAILKQKQSFAPVRVHGETLQPMILLGSGTHEVYIRHAECGDVLQWSPKNRLDEAFLQTVHEPVPHLITASITATANLFRNTLVILDTNYAGTVKTKQPTYHRISFVDTN